MRTLSPKRAGPPVGDPRIRAPRRAAPAHRPNDSPVSLHRDPLGPEEDVEILLQREIENLTGMIAERTAALQQPGRTPQRPAPDPAVAPAPAAAPPLRRGAEPGGAGWAQPLPQPLQESPRSRATALGPARVTAARTQPGLASCAEVRRSPPRASRSGASPSTPRGCTTTHAAVAPQHPFRLRRTPQPTPPLRRLLSGGASREAAPPQRPAQPPPPEPAPQLWPPLPPQPAPRQAESRSSAARTSPLRAAALAAPPRPHPSPARAAAAAPSPGRAARAAGAGAPAASRSASAPPALGGATVELKVNMADLLRDWAASHERRGELPPDAALRFPSPSASRASPARGPGAGSSAGGSALQRSGAGSEDEGYLEHLMQQSREMKRQLDRHQQLTRRAAEAARQREEARREVVGQGARRLRDKLLLLKYLSDQSQGLSWSAVSGASSAAQPQPAPARQQPPG
eukprot:TRINITY_DN14438_c0_g1_i1.p2 TRINITY_DN14438_c0_g1~~TRINITY_DN14438_c0_g1_i1.p2  ORF type:complete len:484 (+),score=136.84 TRINITY_DN14438_c0_g1_i1:80-1453(+)